MSKKHIIILTILLVLLVGVSISFGVRENFLQNIISQIKTESENLSKNLKETETKLTETENTLYETKNTLEQKFIEISDLNNELKKLGRNIKDLEKIIEIDEELLAKYSKVYFLNENYLPEKVEPLEDKYKISPDKKVVIHHKVKKHLENLIDDAREDGVEIRVVSGYRSFEEQKNIKANHLIRYGSGANTFSADQGYSEHQLGTTVDFSNPTFGAVLNTTFDQSKSFAWLDKNAHLYGFILSYPKGNKYYQYEPWHWRFIGRDLAEKLHEEDMNFYDMDQREINEYLGEIFD